QGHGRATGAAQLLRQRRPLAHPAHPEAHGVGPGQARRVPRARGRQPVSDSLADDDLVVEQRGPILVLRLNRPQARNAMTHEMVAGIGSAIVSAEADPATRVVVITGTGDRAFCAGMDLSSYASGRSAVRDPAGRSGYMRFMAGEIAV